MTSALPRRNFQTWRSLKSSQDIFRMYLRRHHLCQDGDGLNDPIYNVHGSWLSGFLIGTLLIGRCFLIQSRGSALNKLSWQVKWRRTGGVHSEPGSLECWEKKQMRGFIKDPGPRHSNSVITVYLLIHEDNETRARFTGRMGPRLVRHQAAQQLWHAPYF